MIMMMYCGQVDNLWHKNLHVSILTFCWQIPIVLFNCFELRVTRVTGFSTKLCIWCKVNKFISFSSNFQLKIV